MSNQLTTITEIIDWVNTEIEQTNADAKNIQEHIYALHEDSRTTTTLWENYDCVDAKKEILTELLNKITTPPKTTEPSNICPRCGKNTMRMPLSTNALSRHRHGVYICSMCGTEEAIEDFNNTKKMYIESEKNYDHSPRR